MPGGSASTARQPPLMNRRWVLRQRPPMTQVALDDGCLELLDEPLPPLQEGEFLVKNLFLTIDPTQRMWMTNPRGTGFVSQVPLNTTMKGGCIGVVIESKCEEYPVGMKTEGMTNWQWYCVAKPGEPRLKKLPADADAAVEIGVAGGTACTAYVGLVHDGKPQAGESVLVTAAAGGTGVMAGQIAKVLGCKVYGTSGTDAKCDWLCNEMGFDGAVNYKKAGNLRGALKQVCPEGFDVVFDNVGGEALEAALALINTNARVVICGAIANYQRETPLGPKNYQALAGKHATMTGFTVYHYRDILKDVRATLRDWHSEGKLHNPLAVYEGVEQAPRALEGLYAGDNMGKIAVRIGTENVEHGRAGARSAL